MKTLIRYLRDHLREDFHPALYGVTALFLTLTVWANYHFGLADRVLYVHTGQFSQLFVWTAFFALPYLFVLGMDRLLRGPVLLQKDGKFWVALVLAFVLPGLNNWFPWHIDLARAFFPVEFRDFGELIFWNLKRLLTMVLPLFAYYKWVDREPSSFYGFRRENFRAAPYLFMLLIVMPGIFWASFQPDFLLTYPTYRPGYAEMVHGISPWVTSGSYELIYGFDFAFVELFFRGFLVIGMVRWLGAKAVLPMAVMYCFLHFGKPAGEAVSSIFGGYLLGVFAYKSGSIWGGIIVHIGLAWLMELFAFLQGW